MRVANQQKPTFRSMLGEHTKQQDPYRFEQVRNGDQTSIDADDNHQIGSDNFYFWMHNPPNTNPHGIGASNADPDMFTKETFQQFQTRYSSENIPEQTLQAVWKAFQLKVTTPQNELSSPPTLEEFYAPIRHLKSNSAPGISGLSYNMIKTWPHDVVYEVYCNLLAMWE